VIGFSFWHDKNTGETSAFRPRSVFYHSGYLCGNQELSQLKIYPIDDRLNGNGELVKESVLETIAISRGKTIDVEEFAKNVKKSLSACGHCRFYELDQSDWNRLINSVCKSDK